MRAIRIELIGGTAEAYWIERNGKRFGLVLFEHSGASYVTMAGKPMRAEDRCRARAAVDEERFRTAAALLKALTETASA